jgi:hypothetical protein
MHRNEWAGGRVSSAFLGEPWCYAAWGKGFRSWQRISLLWSKESVTIRLLLIALRPIIALYTVATSNTEPNLEDLVRGLSNAPSSFH